MMSEPALDQSGDRRSHRRFPQGGRVVTATVRGETFEFALANLSRLGASGCPQSPVVRGDWVQLRFDSDDRVDGIVRWVRDDLCGIEFGRPLGEEVSLDALHRRRIVRAPRYRVARLGAVTVDGTDYPALIRDISERGLRIETLAPIVAGALVVLSCGIAPSIDADVRWARAGVAGLRTRSPIDLETFETLTQSASRSR